jgi:hypothetical protein
MHSKIPADLLHLKKRFDGWRANRKYVREPMPDELRQAALEMSRHYPHRLVRQVLRLDLNRLKKQAAKRPAPATIRRKPEAAFFQLPTTLPLAELASSSSLPSATSVCRLQLERPDGSRLTLTLPALDIVSINRLCADFLRARNR